MTLNRLGAELWSPATRTTRNGGKLKIMTGLHSLSQALNVASIPSYSIDRCIADLSDPPLLDSRGQAEADEAILNGIVSGGSGQSSPQVSRQAPIKVLTRPASSGNDPAAGFSFTKAKPTQQLDFGRPKQTAATQNTTSGPVPPNEVSMSAVETLADSDLNGRSEPRILNITVPSHSKAATAALAPSHGPVEVMRVDEQPQVNMQNRSRNASRDPLTAVVGASKIIRSRRRKAQMSPATEGVPPSLKSKNTYSEDDLLRLLMYRRSQGQQELEHFKVTQHHNEAEIQRLHDMIKILSSQLEEVIQRETQKTTELSELKANKPIWESKIKRLSDYLKGLANDHKRLREDADDLHKQHNDVVRDGKELQNTLKDIQKSVEQQCVRSIQFKDKARHEIETLAQTVQHQSTQLRSDEDLLMAERDRSNRLEHQISKISASHGQLLELFTGHRDTITSKIDNLLQQAQSSVPPSKGTDLDSHDSIRPMLEQCVELLQMLHKADTVKPEDLRKLNDTMDSFVEGIVRSVEACEESSNSVEAGQKQLALAVQDQLRALSGNIFSEHALSEQIKDLREVRATIRERLQAAESSLADTRQEVAALRLKNQEQSRTIVALETVAARAQSQPTEAPQSLLRIQELDSRNKDLQSEIVTLRKEASDLSSQLEQNATDAREVTERVATTRDRLEAALEETTRLREEKSTSERHAMLEREQLRKELSNTANLQLASMQSEHMNVIQQLKLEKSPAEEKLKNVTRQVNMLKTEKEASEKETAKLQALLKGAQNEKEVVIGTRNALQLHLTEMERQMLEKDNECRDMQATLNQAKDQIKAKDKEIVALHASQVTRPSSSRVVEQSSSVRGAQPTRNGQAPHRDFQHDSIDQSSSANLESSSHFTIRPSVLEDSQPTEKPPFVSLDDLMLEDPFAGYAQEGPQTIAGEDISHLFPSTPGTGSRAKDLKYSQKSVFHTTVVSETQRRQHQSFGEATPHTGTHTSTQPTSKSHPQVRTHSKDGRNHAVPSTSAATSPAKVQREASITRESTRPQGSVKDPRGKRNTVLAGFNDANPHARPAKQAKTLGPVIEDSQSPRLNGRSRKMTRRKSSAPKDDKFTRRFAQG